MANFSWGDLPPAEQAILLGAFDKALGFTLERSIEFLEKSQAEGVETDLVSDATGDYEHFLRTRRHWHGAVDAVWPFLQPLARAVVTAAARQQGMIP